MASFQVPQFIEQKAKIVGPFTLGQFFYLAGAVALIFIAFYTLNFKIWLVFSVLISAAAAGLAFVKINGQALPGFLLSALFYFWRPKTYVWRAGGVSKEIDISALEKLEAARFKMRLKNKLKSLNLLLTAKEILSPEYRRARMEKNYTIIRRLTGLREKAKRVDYKA